MKRATKKGSAIYEYLQTTGLLENGTAYEISAAKKLYWKNVRKQWKQKHRSSFKSYTIFFSNKEVRLLQEMSKNNHTSINTLIKNTCVTCLTDIPNIDKKTVAAIRALLLNFYDETQQLFLRLSTSAALSQSISSKIKSLEQTILSLLHQPSNNSF